MQLHKAVFFKWGSAEPKLPVVSKGSTGLPVFSTKKLNCVRHLRPLDVFSRLLVGTKSICGQGSALNPTGGAYSAPPDSITSSVSNQNCCKGFRFTEKVEKCRHKVYAISINPRAHTMRTMRSRCFNPSSFFTPVSCTWHLVRPADPSGVWQACVHCSRPSHLKQPA